MKLKKSRQHRRFVDPASLTRARSGKSKLDNQLVLFISGVETDLRVIRKLDKEAKPVVFAWENLRLKPESQPSLILNSGNAVVGLVLGLANPGHQFFLFETDPGQKRLSQRNIRANEEVVFNVELIDSLEGFKPGVVLIQIQPYVSGAEIRKSLVSAANILMEGGNVYVLAHKRRGGEGVVKEMREIFGSEAVEMIRGGGGNMLIGAVKRKVVAVEDKKEERKEIGFRIFNKDFQAETAGSLFSKEGLDEGTRLLLESTTEAVAKAEKVLDLGCGWGPVSMVVSDQNPKVYIAALDVDPKAVELTRKNLRKIREGKKNFETLCASNPRRLSTRDFDLVLSHPSYHQSGEDLRILFKNTAPLINKRGQIYVVVENSYLDKFSELLVLVFGNAKVELQKGVYSVLKSWK